MNSPIKKERGEKKKEGGGEKEFPFSCYSGKGRLPSRRKKKKGGEGRPHILQINHKLKTPSIERGKKREGEKKGKRGRTFIML